MKKFIIKRKFKFKCFDEISKIPINSSDDKRMQSIDSIETYAYGARKDLVSQK